MLDLSQGEGATAWHVGQGWQGVQGEEREQDACWVGQLVTHGPCSAAVLHRGTGFLRWYI